MKKKVIQLMAICCLGFVGMLGVDLASQASEDLVLGHVFTPAEAQIICPGPGQDAGGCHKMIEVYNVPSPYGPATCNRCEWTGYMDDYCDPMMNGTCWTGPSLGL